MQRMTQQTCNLWDIWSEWSGYMIWQKFWFFSFSMLTISHNFDNFWQLWHYLNIVFYLQPQTKKRRIFGYCSTPIFCSSLNLIVLVVLFTSLHLSMQTSSCTLPTPRATESKYTCPATTLLLSWVFTTGRNAVRSFLPDLQSFSLSSCHLSWYAGLHVLDPGQPRLPAPVYPKNHRFWTSPLWRTYQWCKGMYWRRK